MLKSVTLTFQKLLVLPDGFGTLGGKHIEVKHPSLLEVYGVHDNLLTHNLP